MDDFHKGVVDGSIGECGKGQSKILIVGGLDISQDFM